MCPQQPAKSSNGKPWVFYAPTLLGIPDKAETWMHQQLLEAGIAVAGIDVGETYGSPTAFPHFNHLYQEMTLRGYSTKPVLLGRSRGGLSVSSWALAYPERVAGIAAIYPVFNYLAYPGSQKAAPAYGLSERELVAQADRLNPVNRASELAKAEIPLFIIHGNRDTVVPLESNSARFFEAYQEAEAQELIELQVIEGQGHNYWPGFFQSQQLVDFVTEKCLQ